MSESELIEKYPEQILNILSKHRYYINDRPFWRLSKEGQEDVLENTFDFFLRKKPVMITFEGDLLYLGDDYFSVGKSGEHVQINKYSCNYLYKGEIRDYSKGWRKDGRWEYMHYSVEENAQKQVEIIKAEIAVMKKDREDKKAEKIRNEEEVLYEKLKKKLGH